MGPGRPRLYHTAEEQAANSRERSKRHYNRDKARINHKRRKKYARAHKQNDLHVATDLKTSAADEPARRERTSLSIWLEQANRIQYRLGKLIGRPEISATEFMDKLCIDFFANGDMGIIQEHVDKAGKLQKYIRKYQNEVLALAGIGPDFYRVDAIVKNVCMVVGWVEELLCLAMVDAAEVTRMYETRSLSFQKL